MPKNQNNNIRTLVLGFLIGAALTVALAGAALYAVTHPGLAGAFKRSVNALVHFRISFQKQVAEEFNKALPAVSGQSFGRLNQLTFELFRNGTFEIDGDSGYAWQKSRSYRDSAFIRSTEPLPKTYKITIVAGEIDYNLDKVQKLPQDKEYPEGPQNENGVYLLAITDEKPTGHHTNIWWHQHRKVVIDVDNNTWGHGMPNPIFMVYFNRSNTLMAYDGAIDDWQHEWKKAVTYEQTTWYTIEIEKTRTQYIMSISDHKGKLLKQGRVDLKDVWHADDHHPDYFVVGDPHENYYQGAMKIRSIAMTPTR
jgi:hypothetical protein